MKIITNLQELTDSLAKVPSMPLADRLLMVAPTYFEVSYVINPHMAGQIGKVNPQQARNQWQSLLAVYESLSIPVTVLEGKQGLPDMVFCANQTLPFVMPDGSKGIFCAQMHAPERRGEVVFFKEYFQQKGYEVRSFPSSCTSDFEGMGDALWHPGKRLLWGGYGFRTSLDMYELLADSLQTPVLAIELRDPDFYHLDTCMCVLNETSVLIYDGAFQPQGLDLIRSVFPNVIEVPEEEARYRFAVNAFCPDQQHVLMQSGSEITKRRLEEAGFSVIPCETDEFIKAGGSVFCMKLHYW